MVIFVKKSKQLLTINPQEIPTSELHGWLLSSVAPRPIALASTLDGRGNPNLSPFSFFNVFSARPPILIFSPARRVRDNTVKHTLENVRESGEVVINVVTYDMVHQTSLASTEYERGVNEFLKAGFTMLPSEVVRPFRVAESPVQFECRVTEIRELGSGCTWMTGCWTARGRSTRENWTWWPGPGEISTAVPGKDSLRSRNH